MTTPALLQALADAVLALHIAVVLFVVGGLALIVAGNLRGWRWVNRFWFRLLHIAAILVVAAEAWLGVACPLTTLEVWLRRRAGAAGVLASEAYRDSFVGYWLQRLLYYDAPPCVFTLAYTLFALAVVAVWWRYPPQRRRGRMQP